MADLLITIDIYADDRIISYLICGDVRLKIDEGMEYDTYTEFGKTNLRVTDRRNKFGIPKVYTGKNAETFMKW
jgi:hypothetical protein